MGSCPYSAPEVFYISSLYNNRPYRGCSADVWSCAIILFVMLLGRPPFMRPLAKTYGSNMRRCRHFVAVMKGEGFGGMSGGARDLLMKMMRMQPGDRSTLKEIREDAWYQGPLPSEEDVKRQMEERSKEVYRKLEKTEMIHLMEAVKKEELVHRQLLEDVERERRQREADEERERSAPLTPVSGGGAGRSLEPFPSHSPSSASSRFVQLPPHSGFSFQSASPPFASTRKDSEEAELGFERAEPLAVSRLSLDDSPSERIRPVAQAVYAAGRLEPSDSSPPTVRLLSASSASPSGALSPSPPPSASSPSYPWGYR